jgi:hypothetical protein
MLEDPEEKTPSGKPIGAIRHCCFVIYQPGTTAWLILLQGLRIAQIFRLVGSRLAVAAGKGGMGGAPADLLGLPLFHQNAHMVGMTRGTFAGAIRPSLFLSHGLSPFLRRSGRL